MNKPAFTLLEVVVAVALILLMSPAIIKLITFGSLTSSQGERYSQAYMYGQEGMEAIFYLKSNSSSGWDWTAIPENTNPGEFYQPYQDAGLWKLGGKTTAPQMGLKPFTRKITITQVRRCGSDICDSGSAPVDPYSRLIKVYVDWQGSAAVPEHITLESYVTKY